MGRGRLFLGGHQQRVAGSPAPIRCVGAPIARVAPNLYVACGISGAVQHWVGMMASKNVLAINNDPEAPMVTKANYAVIGDLHPILEAVVAEVKRRKGVALS